MKKYIILCNLGSLLIIAATINIFEVAVRFITVGEVPLIGSNVSPDVMLTVIAILTLVFILYLIPRHLTKKTIDDIKAHRHRLPKQRYKRV